MRKSDFIFFVFLIFIFLSCQKNSEISQVENSPDSTGNISKVLFIGNSFTFYNSGIDYHLQKMLEADNSINSLSYDIQKIAESSYTLERHYKESSVIDEIQNNNWDIVVLQEQSTRPINNPALFMEYAVKLDEIIKKDSAETVLFMTWASQDAPLDIEPLAASYNQVGEEINAEVVPVGKVWEYIAKLHPGIILYVSDNKHPTMAGTFVTTCAFYYSLFNRNPENNSYEPNGLSKKDIISIRESVYTYMSTYNTKSKLRNLIQ